MDKIIIDTSTNESISIMRDALSKELLPNVKNSRPIIILCIGTDRSTGDCLGPLVGEKLRFLIRNNVILYGNLERPVHAKNLCDVIDEINANYINPYIIAVDACLGTIQNVGKIIMERKALCPGSAMNKDLPHVGDLSITGIVNISGTLEFMVLQNTRLYTVMHLADIISKGIYHSLIKTMGGRRNAVDQNITADSSTSEL